MAGSKAGNEKRIIPAGSHILMVTGDLMFSSKVDALARQAGIAFEAISASRLETAGSAEGSFALLDMTNMDFDSVGRVVGHLKGSGADQIAVFGRHDRGDLRKAGLESGASYWWPNSKMAVQMQALLGLSD